MGSATATSIYLFSDVIKIKGAIQASKKYAGRRLEIT